MIDPIWVKLHFTVQNDRFYEQRIHFPSAQPNNLRIPDLMVKTRGRDDTSTIPGNAEDIAR